MLCNCGKYLTNSKLNMAVNNTILKIIIKNCCRSLSFDDERQQFAFPFRPTLSEMWGSMRGHIHDIDPTFHIDNFNSVLHRLARLTELSMEQPLYEAVDVDLLQGEMLRVNLSNGGVPMFTLIKMKHGQYLDITSGRGYSLGDKAKLLPGKTIITSEGEELGVCKSITLLMPTAEHIVMGRVMLGAYYRSNIATSLWPLLKLAKTANYANSKRICAKLTSTAKDMGIGIMPLLNIINSPVQYGIR